MLLRDAVLSSDGTRRGSKNDVLSKYGSRSRGIVCVRTPCGVSPAFFSRKPISTAFSLTNVPGICALSYVYLQMWIPIRIGSDRHPRPVGERGVASVFVP